SRRRIAKAMEERRAGNHCRLRLLGRKRRGSRPGDLALSGVLAVGNDGFRSMFRDVGGEAEMSPLLKWLIGLRQLPQEAGEGAWHVEFQSLPNGFLAILCVAVA